LPKLTQTEALVKKRGGCLCKNAYRSKTTQIDHNRHLGEKTKGFAYVKNAYPSKIAQINKNKGLGNKQKELFYVKTAVGPKQP
jgi:hypothetical protein